MFKSKNTALLILLLTISFCVLPSMFLTVPVYAQSYTFGNSVESGYSDTYTLGATSPSPAVLNNFLTPSDMLSVNSLTAYIGSANGSAISAMAIVYQQGGILSTSTNTANPTSVNGWSTAIVVSTNGWYTFTFGGFGLTLQPSQYYWFGIWANGNFNYYYSNSYFTNFYVYNNVPMTTFPSIVPSTFPSHSAYGPTSQALAEYISYTPSGSYTASARDDPYSGNYGYQGTFYVIDISSDQFSPIATGTQSVHFNSGDYVEVKCWPPTGTTFNAWYERDNTGNVLATYSGTQEPDGSNALLLTMGASSRTFLADYNVLAPTPPPSPTAPPPSNNYNIYMFNYQSSAGTYSWSPTGAYQGGTSSTWQYAGGTSINLTATASYGYNFDHWNIGGVTYTDNPHILVVSSSLTVTCVFSLHLGGPTPAPTATPHPTPTPTPAPTGSPTPTSAPLVSSSLTIQTKQSVYFNYNDSDSFQIQDIVENALINFQIISGTLTGYGSITLTGGDSGSVIIDPATSGTLQVTADISNFYLTTPNTNGIYNFVPGTPLVISWKYTSTPVIIITQGKTYYFRSDTYTTLQTNGYGIDSSYTNTAQTINETYGSTGTVNMAFQIYLFNSPTVSTELTSGPSAIISVNGNVTGEQTGTFLMPQTDVVLGYQALQVNVLEQFGGGNWITVGTFISPVLITQSIESSTWSFNLYINNQESNNLTQTSFQFGNHLYPSNIGGISFLKPNTSDIAMWDYGRGDVIGMILIEYLAPLGSAFYVLILLGFTGSLWYRYKNAGIILYFIVTLVSGGFMFFFLPIWAAAVAAALILLIMTFLFWRLLR